MKKDLIGMRLGDALGEIHKNEILHIGSGTGFLFVGNKKDFEEDEKEINKYLINQEVKIIAKQVRQIRKEADEIGIRKRRIDEIREAIRKINRLCDRIDDRKGNLKPLSDRRILDFYGRIQKDGIVILIEGTENGKYWGKDDYDKEKG